MDVGVLLDWQMCPDLELERLPGFRNVVIHEYVALDLDRVVDALRHLDAIDRFIAIVSQAEEGAGQVGRTLAGLLTPVRVWG